MQEAKPAERATLVDEKPLEQGASLPALFKGLTTSLSSANKRADVRESAQRMITETAEPGAQRLINTGHDPKPFDDGITTIDEGAIWTPPDPGIPPGGGGGPKGPKHRADIELMIGAQQDKMDSLAELGESQQLRMQMKIIG